MGGTSIEAQTPQARGNSCAKIAHLSGISGKLKNPTRTVHALSSFRSADERLKLDKALASGADA
jgi:hypothetical protein